MPRTVTAAAVRLSNNPAPTGERLRVAEAQVVKAAKQGAQLVVLPELFNTGYVYSSDNYARAEPLGGPTVTWMKRLAAEHKIHLAGALMLLGSEHITNSLMLVAPDGQSWRYDKNYPWMWERLYFREGRDITVAETSIGTFGLMICVDVASADLFKRYAGKVDALVISSSPPRMHELMFHFPDGPQVSLGALMRMSAREQTAIAQVFNDHLLRFTTWMRVPVINAIPYGQFATRIPLPWLSFFILLAARPSLWKYYPQVRDVVATAGYFGDNQIADASGTVLARYDAEADGYALATIELPEARPVPRGRPPHSAIRSADSMDWLIAPFYRRGVRRVWGRHMAPVDRSTRRWMLWLAGAWLVGNLQGRLGRPRFVIHKRRRA